MQLTSTHLPCYLPHTPQRPQRSHRRTSSATVPRSQPPHHQDLKEQRQHESAGVQGPPAAPSTPRNPYPSLGLSLSQWVDEQMGGEPAPWMEPWYTQMNIGVNAAAGNGEDAEDEDSSSESVISHSLRAPRIGRRRGLLEAQLQAPLQPVLLFPSPLSKPQASAASGQLPPAVPGKPNGGPKHVGALLAPASMAQEEIREVLLLHQCLAPKRLVQGVQYMIEQQCFPCGRSALSSWLQGVVRLEQRVPIKLRALLPKCYHIMLRSVEELEASCTALGSLLNLKPQQVAEYVTRNPHLLYKTAPELLGDFEALVQMTHLPQPLLVDMAASCPGLLGHTHEGLCLKWQRLRAAASSSASWQAELTGAGVDLRLLAATLCAPHASLDRLSYLNAVGRDQGDTSLVQAVTASDADFQHLHPEFMPFQAQHALLGAHYATSSHPTQRLLLQGGADLPRGSAGRWVNMHIQQRSQKEAAERSEVVQEQALERQRALATELVLQDEWKRAASRS